MQPLYTTTATAVGGRDGRVTSEDGNLNLDVRTPKELGGSGEQGTNPEQLFAAGYAACFESALNMVARQKKIKPDHTEITANVSIGKDDEGGFGLAVKLAVHVEGVSEEQAKELAEGAHENCPYSKATRGNIEVDVTVA
ncbi:MULTISPECIES: organic hydroperoxide resistance protein [Marinococcus]|jgi:Ohr subfamily peroxiredoxin|uniref:organic hydroperoxide resistance protein n=1 Tax=Marinococcus TaxID=1370 RepID=UPI0003B32EBD|nr:MULTISPECIES: organic hydroperoxide resistance protein [Marinococcus]MDX6153083.1 organic hydroperoxide resistance protein [Marinococcus sp. PL1-022]